MNDSETTWIEDEYEYAWYAWTCEKCGECWVFEYGSPVECEYRYCPGCGRKITEFVAEEADND